MSNEVQIKKKMKIKRREKKRLYWRQEETQYFLSLCLRRNVLGQLGVLSKGNAFELLSKEMRDVGFDKSARQCRTKVKHLKCDYRRMGKEMLFGNEVERLINESRRQPTDIWDTSNMTVIGIKSEVCIKQEDEDSNDLSSYNEFDIVEIKTEVEDPEVDEPEGSNTMNECKINDPNNAEYSQYNTIPQDTNNITTENCNNVDDENILGMNPDAVLKKQHTIEYDLLINTLLTNQETFVGEVMEIQKKSNKEIIEKLYEHQRNQLNIVMKKYSKLIKDVNIKDSSSE